MEKIASIRTYSLHNDEQLQMMNDFDGAVTKAGAGELGVANQVPAFKAALAVVVAAMRVEQGSATTTEIENLDSMRDNTLLGIYKRVDSALHSPVAAEAASALVLQRIIDKYGDVRSWEYSAETNSINLLLLDLQATTMATHLQAVGIAAWVAALKTQNDQFLAAYNKRDSEIAARASGNTKAARKPLDVCYNTMVDTINATIQLGLAKPVAITFVKEWNLRVQHYRELINERRSNGKSNKNDVAAPKA